MEAVGLAGQLDEFRLIDAVHIHIVGEEPGDAARAGCPARACGSARRLAILLGEAVGADRAEQARKLGVGLPVLLGQIADRWDRDRARRARHRRRASCPPRPGCHFGAWALVAADDRRKLEEVADEHHLQAAEGGIRSLRTNWQTRLTAESVCPDSIETSSTISTRVFLIRSVTRRLLAIASISRRVMRERVPMPLQAWTVMPPSWAAAMPVDAVMADGDALAPQIADDSGRRRSFCRFRARRSERRWRRFSGFAELRLVSLDRVVARGKGAGG